MLHIALALALVAGTPVPGGPRWTVSARGPEGARIGLAVTGAKSAWAAFNGELRRWDGRRWTVVRSPFGPGPGVLDVSGRSARSVWAFAVGRTEHVQAARWDGARWHKVKRPGAEFLGQGPSVALPGELWWASDDRLLRYREGRWTKYKLPAEAYDIDATSGKDLWLAGTNAAFDTPLVYRRKDGRWRRTPLPRLKDAALTDIEAVSAKEVWLTGYETYSDLDYRPLLLRWDGRSWKRIPTDPLKRSALRVTVAADGRGGVRLSGLENKIAHYDGRRWTFEPTPVEGYVTQVLRAPGSRSFWATMASTEAGGGALVLRLRG